MRKVLSFVLVLMLVAASAAFANAEGVYYAGDIPYYVSGEWISDDTQPGESVHYLFDGDTSRCLLATYYDADELHTGGDEGLMASIIDRVYGNSRWKSIITPIETDAAIGISTHGDIEGLNAAVAYMESDRHSAVFVLGDLGYNTLSARLNDELLELIDPYAKGSGDESGLKTFEIGNYTYTVPSVWDYKKQYGYDENYHTAEDGDLYFSVNWKTHDGADMESALQMLYRAFPGLQVEFLTGETMGFLMDGECITGMKMIKACIAGYPGYVEITYRHDGSENQREEFDQLLASFENMM